VLSQYCWISWLQLTRHTKPSGNDTYIQGLWVVHHSCGCRLPPVMLKSAKTPCMGIQCFKHCLTALDSLVIVCCAALLFVRPVGALHVRRIRTIPLVIPMADVHFVVQAQAPDLELGCVRQGSGTLRRTARARG
jgi:hypothetical protein